jgi:restriction endonuclease
LRGTLSSFDAEYYFRDLDYGERIDHKVFDLLYALRGFVDETESEFFNPILESMFAEFRSKVYNLLYKSDLSQTVVTGDNVHMIPRKYQNRWNSEEYKMYLEEFNDLQKRLNSAAGQLYEAYAKLIRECRRQLAVD